jgi:hypothetical protein
MVMAVKVKQDMIDFIKNQGMAAALKRAGSLSAKGGKGEAEFIEGVRRMYGANRLSAATKAATPASPKMPGKGPAATMGTKAAAAKAAPTKTMYNRLTGEKVTYKETPKAKAKPKAPVEPPKYNRYTGAKVDYTTKPASTPKPKAKKPVAPAPKYNRYTQQKVK